MASEIERKFIVGNAAWREGAAGIEMAQGYLSMDAARTVRVRVAGGAAWLTIKGPSEGISRVEYEYEIPLEDARAMLEMSLPSIIEKTRYRIFYNGYVWEIDVFHGENEGLIMAEVELIHESDAPEIPPWQLTEVSGDLRYFNSYLAMHPFKSWPAQGHD